MKMILWSRYEKEKAVRVKHAKSWDNILKYLGHFNCLQTNRLNILIYNNFYKFFFCNFFL